MQIHRYFKVLNLHIPYSDLEYRFVENITMATSYLNIFKWNDTEVGIQAKKCVELS